MRISRGSARSYYWKISWVLAGLPIESTGKVINRFCGSSMDAVHQLSTSIEAGDIDAGIAVGVEDMFSVPMGGSLQIFIQN